LKIKEICEKTGLTDRTVRYYIEEGLISPFYTENYLGRKAFDFSEQDLDRLKSIATLRSFGFTVEEIKALSLGDADSKQIVDAVKQRASESLDESQRRIHVLRELDLSSEGDLLELSRKLYDRDMAIRNENVSPAPKKRLLSFLRSCAIFLAVWLPIFLAGVVLVVKIAVLDMPIVRPVFLFCTLLCFLPSLFIVLILKKTNETKKVQRILTLLCLVCLPLSIFFSYKSITVCEHNYDTYRTIVAATCSREGEAVLTCKECGGFSVKKVQKLPHQTVVTKGYAPTCSRAGLSDGSYCSVCRETLVAQTVIAATNDHTPVIDAAVPANCGNTGLTEGSHCSVCNKVLVRQIELPIIGRHSFSFMTNKCSLCNLEVIEHGNADGTLCGGNDKVKYYITGDLENYEDFEIVIYGDGEMPNSSLTSPPTWYEYLPYAEKIRIEHGITSIGAYAFYEPTSITPCSFIMSDTVKTIKAHAISLKIRNLTLGNAVETVEHDGIGNVDSIYIPKSVKKFYSSILGNEIYFYEGTLEEFYQIKTYHYNRVITVKEQMAMLNDQFKSNIHIYLQAKNITDTRYYWR